eukprot:GHVU01225642.1.p2 GENE.GHVU01225642.1~~GHVU01225642.1.p2  ORF type:complete len:111 (+),score=24.83 GHVU01225642.1:40-372(+)
MQVLINYANNTIGVLEKGRYGSSDAQCSRPAACVGEETFFPPNNRCEPPQCDLFFFRRLDPASMRCETRPYAVASLVVSVAALLFADFFMRVARSHLISFETRRALSPPY